MAVTRELAMQRQQWRDNRPDHPPRHKVDSEGFQTVRRRKHHLPGSPHGISVKIEAKTVEFKELSGLEEETLHSGAKIQPLQVRLHPTNRNPMAGESPSRRLRKQQLFLPEVEDSARYG